MNVIIDRKNYCHIFRESDSIVKLQAKAKMSTLWPKRGIIRFTIMKITFIIYRK